MIKDDGLEEKAIAFTKSSDSDEGSSGDSSQSTDKECADLGEDGLPKYHQPSSDELLENVKRKERDFRKKLNHCAREAVSASVHKNIKLVVHRPDYDLENQKEYAKLSRELIPVVREIVRKTLPLLENEISNGFTRNHYYGGRFQVESVVYKDFKCFARKSPPSESPSLAVGLRIDESASMTAFGRLEAAKRTVIAVYEFCRACGIPVLIYGDTADISKLEQMSIYAYADFEKTDETDRFRLMGIRGRSNNRDGMALRIMADRLAALPHRTKLLISLSDGQPKAMPDYTGSLAAKDMQQTISSYERKGITFLAAATGYDKDVINRIYGNGRFLDVTNPGELPGKLVRLISRYL